MKSILKKEGVFWTEGLKNMREVGTVCSTSRFVAKVIAPKIQKTDEPKVVVELGVGTGGITKEILKHLRAQDCYIGIEANKKFLEICKEGLCAGNPRTERAEQSSYDGDRNISVNFEHGFAQNIREILKKYGISQVDEIICTIPFRILPKKDTAEILRNARKVIKSGGHFTFIRYIWAPENKDVSRTLHDFAVVDKKIIMRNIPPAEVIKMRKH